jgi:transitional endoplasmic reticulum ATPase
MFSGVYLGALVSEAVMLAIRECVLAGKGKEEAQFCEYRQEAKHFEEALKKVQPTASEEEIYKRFVGSKAI